MADNTASKGYDDSPPRNGVITFYTVLAVVVLFGASQLLKSYFAKMMDTEYTEKVYTVGLEATQEYKAREHEQLEKSGISSAIKSYAQRGRAASPVLVAESGAGKAAITGWSQLKREVPTAPAAPEAVPVQGATLAPDAKGTEQAPPLSGNANPSQGTGARITPEGQPNPTHDDPKNSKSPATDTGASPEAAKGNNPANKQGAINQKPSATTSGGNSPAPQQ